MGNVSGGWIEGDVEVSVDDTAWGDETRCGWKGKGVRSASVGRVKGRQWQTGNFFALASHDDGNCPSLRNQVTNPMYRCSPAAEAMAFARSTVASSPTISAPVFSSWSYQSARSIRLSLHLPLGPVRRSLRQKSRQRPVTRVHVLLSDLVPSRRQIPPVSQSCALA